MTIAITAAVAGQTKVVVLKDGRKFTGEVTKTTTGYQVRTKYAVFIFAAEQVASITGMAKPEDEYKQRLAKIDPKDAQARLALGQWAFKKGLLKIAKKEYEAVLDIDPGLEMAELELRRVKAELARISKEPTTQSTSTNTGNNGGNFQIPDEWLVTTEDVPRIRLAEYKAERDRFGNIDTGTGVTFRNNVIERFITMMQGKLENFDAKKFRSRSVYIRLKTILLETEEESIRKDIVLKRDCMVMRDFRGRIWPVVASKCASLTCHGAPKGQGKFKLLNIAARNERIDYSNFMILTQYFKSQGRMLDRDNADESLLLHYGLPSDDEKVKYKHPGKKDLSPPPFASVTAKNYLTIKKWIESLRGPPYGGSYDVKYQAPYGPKPEPPLVLNPTTRPAGN